jgi:hypothetical protein
MSGPNAAIPSWPYPADLDRKWVVMIYMAATSPRLCDAMERDLKELNQRLSNLGLNDLFVVVQADTPDGQYVTRQRLLGGGRVKALPPGRLPPSLGNLSAKQHFIKDFLHWRFHDDTDWYWLGSSRKSAPTEADKERGEAYGCPVQSFGRTLFVLWGHSQGIANALSQPGSPAFAMVGAGGFGFDPLYGDALTLSQIRCAIIEGLKCQTHPEHRLQILSFDSCFMSAAEAAIELQEQATVLPVPCGGERLRVDLLLAAQTAILLDGLDYSRLADVFVPDNCVEPVDLGLRILDQAAYGSDSPTSLSLLRLHPRPASGPQQQEAFSCRFEGKFKGLVDELRRVLAIPRTNTGATNPRLVTSPANRAEWLRIRDAFESATWHRVRQFLDLADLCRRLLNNSRDTGLRAAAWRVLEELRTDVPDVTQDMHSLFDKQFLIDVRTAHPHILSGISVYCPWLHPTPEETRDGAWNAVVSLEDYQELRFSLSTGWGELLYDAKVLLEEARQRSINAEFEDLRRAIDLAAKGHTDPPARRDFERFRVEQPKPPDDRFHAAEPAKPREYDRSRPKDGDARPFSADDVQFPVKKALNLLSTE